VQLDHHATVHIPDGFIDGKTTVTTAVLAVAGVGLALRHVRRTLPARHIPMLGLSAAFLFAAQMLNFPVVAGTSGHLIGGVLVAAVLGPSAAVVVVTTVLIVQNRKGNGVASKYLTFGVQTPIATGSRSFVSILNKPGDSRPSTPDS